MHRVGVGLLQGLATIAAAASAWAASGCSADTFACASDQQCQAGSVEGQCELNGYCSFPDESCPSNQRFGDAAPDGVANVCVELDDGGSSTTTEAIEDGLPPDPDDSPLETTTPGSTDDGETTVALDDATTGDPTATTAEASTDDGTTGEPTRCAWRPYDEFEDDEIDPMWSVSAPEGVTVAEIEGQLEVTLPISFGDWFVGAVWMDLPPMSGGFTRVLVTDLVGGEPSVTVGLAWGNGVCDFQLHVNDGTINVFIWYVEEGAGELITTEANWRLPVWLQLRQDDMGELYFEWSTDQTTWETLLSGTFPECGDVTGPMTLLVGSGGDSPLGSVRRIDTFDGCVP